MSSLTGARRPLGGPIVLVAIALSLAFATLALAVGYWGVVQAPELTRSPNDAAVIAAARTVPRGRIVDRTGKVLARNEKELWSSVRGENNKFLHDEQHLFRFYPDKIVSAEGKLVVRIRATDKKWDFIRVDEK